jgi:hypothetical protein
MRLIIRDFGLNIKGILSRLTEGSQADRLADIVALSCWWSTVSLERLLAHFLPDGTYIAVTGNRRFELPNTLSHILELPFYALPV